MSVATSTAIGLGIAGAGLVGGVASSAIGAGEAGKAASTQANSANYAANLQSQEAQNALNFQEQQYNQGQSNLAPWLQSGAGALSALNYGLGISPQGSAGPQSQVPMASYGGSPTSPSGLPSAPGLQTASGSNLAPLTSRTPLNTLANRPTSGALGTSANVNPGSKPTSGLGTGGALDPATGQPTAPSLVQQPAGQSSAPGYGSLLQGFQAPTAAEAAATPGYQFAQQQGQMALQNSAAAKGGLLSGNTATALDQYSQGLADSNYQNTYNNAFNTFNSNQSNQFNRLASLAGVGQTAANQLNSQGQSAAANIGNISQTAGQQIGQSAQNAGAATASGYINTANAANYGINSGVNAINQGAGIYLSQLQNNNPGNFTSAENNFLDTGNYP